MPRWLLHKKDEIRNGFGNRKFFWPIKCWTPATSNIFPVTFYLRRRCGRIANDGGERTNVKQGPRIAWLTTSAIDVRRSTSEEFDYSSFSGGRARKETESQAILTQPKNCVERRRGGVAFRRIDVARRSWTQFVCFNNSLQKVDWCLLAEFCDVQFL